MEVSDDGTMALFCIVHESENGRRSKREYPFNNIQDAALFIVRAHSHMLLEYKIQHVPFNLNDIENESAYIKNAVKNAEHNSSAVNKIESPFEYKNYEWVQLR